MSTLLTAALRSNLHNLNSLSDQMASVQERLTTGRKVNNASDDAYAYFTERNLRQTASDLDDALTGMDKGLKTLGAATAATKSISDILNRVGTLLDMAESTGDLTERNGYRIQIVDMLEGIETMARSAEYQNTNLIGADGILLQASDDITHQINIAAMTTLDFTDLTTTGMSSILGAANIEDATYFDTDGNITAVRTALANFSGEVEQREAELGNYQVLVKAQQNLVKELSSLYSENADNLVMADMNAESVNMQTLQTRQTLATITLGIASEEGQNVLRLF